MKTASRIFGSAAFHAGFVVQDSPTYGAEPLAGCGLDAAELVSSTHDLDLPLPVLRVDFAAMVLQKTERNESSRWLYDSGETAQHRPLADDTGLFAPQEAVNGELHYALVRRRRCRAEHYLKGQGRYRCLFESELPERPGRYRRLFESERTHALSLRLKSKWMATGRLSKAER